MKQPLCNRIAWTVLALGLPIAALADLSQTTTLQTNSRLNLDTGATPSSGGDILWNGSTITLQGNAKAAVVPGISGAAGFGALNQSTLQAFSSLASSAPISSTSLTTGTILAAFTNAGNPAKVLVTANSGGSITLQFTTYGASGGGSGPSITRVTNNSSDIPAGFPNSGISQGALFKVVGSSLADDGDANLHDSQAGLPTTLNGAKITVTVGNTTVPVALYYATPTQIDGVLPANTPTGSGTLTVTHNGTVSATIQVVAAAPGITTYNNGTVVAQDTARPTDPYGGLITFTKSAVPGGTIIIWGSGFGATGDSDTVYTGTPHQTSVPYTVYIGGVQANVTYAGRSVYPGVSVFAVLIPQNVPTGCYVPVAAVTGNVVSNIGTLPIRAGGGACSDPQLGFSGDQISTLSGKDTVKTGTVVVSQTTLPGAGATPVTSNGAAAIFQQVTGASYAGGNAVSMGGCILVQTLTGGSTGTTTGLDPGTITVTGPGGAPVALSGFPGFAGVYSATLPAIPSTGGAYVFNASGGSGANAVGSFTTTVTFPNPLLSWTNQSAAANVARSQGLTFRWSGGTPGSFITLYGSSVSGTASGSYICTAPQSAGQFTVPSYVLLGLPAGTGGSSVQNSTNYSTFSASGLDFAGAVGSVLVGVNSNYN
ncbi:MAG: hypothetical protein JWO19_425 [Bryobacterales bacterium]|jgi:uncharacterized protein (TIGR03437 family)|nr:hypothetical protein [Bryobacterales bacterium]